MPNIIPIKELKNTSDISDLCHASDEPIFVTKNGYGDMVLMSMPVYERMLKRLTLYRELLESEWQLKHGETLPARQALQELREKYDL